MIQQGIKTKPPYYQSMAVTAELSGAPMLLVFNTYLAFFFLHNRTMADKAIGGFVYLS